MSASTPPIADVSALQADLAALKRDVADLMTHLKSNAAATVQGATEKLEDGATRIMRSISDEGERSMKAVGQKIEEQPLMALLIAFGVGYLGGRTLGR